MFKAIPTTQPGELLIRGVPFGGPDNRDVKGQYFTERTNFFPHIFPNLPIYHFHGSRMGSLALDIGRSITREQKEDGIYYRVKLFLDSTNEAVKKKASELWEAALKGYLFASSGAVPASIKVDPETGFIEQWLVGELSLIDIRNKGERPASFYATATPIKADELAGIAIEGEPDIDFETIFDPDIAEPEPELTAPEPEPELPRSEPIIMEPDQIKQLQEQIKAMQEQLAAMPQLQAKVTELNGQVQQRDNTINALQQQISLKSAETEAIRHRNLVDSWISDGKIPPEKADEAMNILALAYDTDIKSSGDGKFITAFQNFIGGLRPTTNYNYLNGASIYHNRGTETNPNQSDTRADVERLAHIQGINRNGGAS